MNSHQTLPSAISSDIANEWVHWLRRILQTPMTFIVLVWALMLALVGVCFALMD